MSRYGLAIDERLASKSGARVKEPQANISGQALMLSGSKKWTLFEQGRAHNCLHGPQQQP